MGMTSFPEFNVQYYYPGAAGAALHGTTESNNFVAAMDQVLTKQAGVIEALEKSAKRAFLVEGSDRVTQSPMVWLNLHHGASLLEGTPMGESQATVNVFEAPRSLLLSPQSLSAPFEVMDFFVESGSGALPGAAALESFSTKSDEMIRKVKPSASLMEALPAFNVHVAQGSVMEAVQLSEAQQ